MTTEIERQMLLPKQGIADAMLERLAEKVGMHANSSTVYAPPVEKDGVVVVGVAKVRWGFGGGAGADKEGSGGGAGVSATPIGFIEISDGRAEFKPIQPWGIESAAAVALIVLVSGTIAVRLLRTLGKILRG